MKVVVIGSGAMGCRFGAALHRAGADVWLYDVYKLHVDAINERGLIIHNGNAVENIKMHATADIGVVPAVDLAILFTKSIYTRSALQTTCKVLHGNTAILTLQNGLGNIEQISEFAPRENIIAGITNYATDLKGPGEISFTGDGIARIMPLGTKMNAFAEELARLLTVGGCKTVISSDVMKDIWEKVAFNAAMNTLTFITEETVGGIGSTAEGQALMKAISSDVIRVARADGVNADEAAVHKVLMGLIGPHADHKPSMLQDRLAARRTEIDAICGAVVARGDDLGVPIECVRTIYRIVRMIESYYLNNKK